MSELGRLLARPEVRLGIAITVGLALGSGALDGLLPFGRPDPAPAPAEPAGSRPAPAPTEDE